ncbi:hypothetical protein [Streptomyces sp. AN091965]|uniref:hypothetical protein n=1 Tax=Streptomyces sp. AN091965 TaxID=2927803 RepID=UPI001F615005|nr:hypothetical protein [Streptomyces sp. AN091965]MCI3928071.1 hypothetical protein [Streptomyces sp. AN091965]
MRRRRWPVVAAVWVLLVVVGGLLTLYLNGGEDHAVDPGRGVPSETPSSTYDYPPCPSPAEDDATLLACAHKVGD